MAVSDGQVQSALPGLHVATPPRRPARGRHPDRLILYLHLLGNAPMTPERSDQLLGRLAETYYKTPGTATTAIRTIIEALNQFLLDRNVRGSNSGQQSAGLFFITVVRQDHLYLAVSGPVHAFLIGSYGVQHFHDPQTSGRGLGLSRAAPLRFFQAEFKPNDTLVLTANPPSGWNVSLLGSLFGQGPESFRRRLLGQADIDLSAVMIQAKAGTGKTFVLRPKPGPITPAPAPESAEESFMAAPTPAEAPSIAPIALPKGIETHQMVVDSGVTIEQPAHEGAPPVMGKASPESGTQTTYPLGISERSTGQPTSVKETPPASFRRSAPAHRRNLLQPLLLPILKAVDQSNRVASKILSPVIRGGRILFTRMLPGEFMFTLPSSVMAFIAVAIPLIVVTIATVIYFRSGRASQFQVYFQQAEKAAAAAQAQTDPQLQRDAWQTALAYLDQAERYEVSPNSQALRSQAFFVLDTLEGIKRLNYQPAIKGGVPATYQITQIAATDTELYMLDSLSGNIGRANALSQGYERDDEYQCGPGFAGAEGAGALIDLAVLPKGNKLDSTILGMDEDGTLLECAPGEAIQVINLTPPPTGFGKLKGFTLDISNLYVLDPDQNAVWIYWKSKFSDEPELFFSENVPPMKDVVDLAVEKSDLYLLHEDGHVTLCTYSDLEVSPTRCTDPIPYIDSRPGRENQPFVFSAPFTKILSTQPPDPSLYFLEPNSQSIYQFSFRTLTYHRQFQPLDPFQAGTPPSAIPATAFNISSDNRTAFLAFGNELLYASMP